MINCYRCLSNTFHHYVDHDGSANILPGALYGPVYWAGAYKSFQPHDTSFSWPWLLHTGRHFLCADILYDNCRVDFILHFRFFLVKTRLGVLRQRFQHEQ